MRFYIHERDEAVIHCTRIDNDEYTIFDYQAKSFTDPKLHSIPEVGKCYNFLLDKDFKIYAVHESTGEIARDFLEILELLNTLPHKRYIIQEIRKHADKIASLKKSRSSDNFWRYKKCYVPWFFEQKIKEALQLKESQNG